MTSCGSLTGNAPAGTVRKCLRTRKSLSTACFDMNPKTGKPYGSCVVCVPKNRAQHNAYGATTGGKAKRKIQNDKESIKALKANYRGSAIGKAKAKEYHGTDAFLQKCRDYAKTDAGKASRKRSYDNHKLSHALMNATARVLHGASSELVEQHTSFDDDSLREHFASAVGDYCVDWTVDHHIPRSAYNHNDPEDVKRCWSPANMHPMGPKANKEKWNKILSEHVAQVPTEFYPKAWAGVARTASPDRRREVA